MKAANAAATAAAASPAAAMSVDGGDTDSMGASTPSTPGRDADADWAAGMSDDEEDDEATLDEEEVSFCWQVFAAYNSKLAQPLQSIVCDTVDTKTALTLQVAHEYWHSGS